VLRTKFLEKELERLIRRSNRENFVPVFNQSLSKKSSPAIISILQEMFALPLQIRESYLAVSISKLQRKAVILIKYVEHEMKINGSDKMLHLSAVKRLKEDMDLSQNDEDFYVVLNMAEKISSGVYFKVEGDPYLLPEYFLELFESF